MADGFDLGGMMGDFGGAGDIQTSPTQVPMDYGSNIGGLTADPLAFSGPTAPGGTGFDLNALMGGAAKYGLPLLNLGVKGLGAFTGIEGMKYAGEQQNILKQAERTAQQAAAPGIAAAGQLIPAGTSALMGGALPPQLEQVAVNWANNAKAQMRQRLAHMGITDSTMLQQLDAWVDAQAQELRANLAQGLLTGGEGAAQGAVGAAGVSGQLAANQGSSINQAIQAANQAMMSLFGSTG